MQTTFCPYCMRLVMSDVCPHCGRDVNYPGNPMHLPVGTTLVGSRAYVVGACRGQGGFGVTYIALDTETNERVAIKEYFPTYCSGRNGNTTIQPYYGQEEPFLKGKERFLDEARMVQSLSDLGSVVKVSDFFEVNNTAYLVMEFLDGGSLKDYVERNGKMDAQQLLRQLKPLMADMEAMHRRGVIHRDIAPDNIILQPDGTLKLIDFGAARSYLGEKSMSVVVKKGFAPVEQYMRSGMGAYTDVYALAASIYYCITGIVPSDSAERQFGEIGLRSPIELGADLTAEQEQALEHALQLQPRNRTQSMQQFMQELFEVKKEPEPILPVTEYVPPVTEREIGFVETVAVTEQKPAPVQKVREPLENVKPQQKQKAKKSPFVKVAAILAAVAALVALGIFAVGGLFSGNEVQQQDPQLQLPTIDQTTLPEKPAVETELPYYEEPTAAPTIAPLDPVTIRIWFHGANVTPDASAKVLKEVNAYLKDKINVTLEPIWGTWGDFDTNVMSSLAGGDDVDIYFTSNWSANEYNKYARDGYYVKLDDMLATYAPDIMNIIPEGIWECAKTNGYDGMGIYAVPALKDTATQVCWDVNGTLLAELGYDVDAVCEAGLDFFSPEFEAMLQAAKDAKGADFYPLLIEAAVLERGITSTSIVTGDLNNANVLSFYYDPANPGKDIGSRFVNKFGTEEFAAFAAKIYEYSQKGFISPSCQNISTANDYRTATWFTGEYLFGTQSYAFGCEYEYATALGFDVRMVPMTAAYMDCNSSQGAMMAISSVSKNPERALMFLNLLNSDPKLMTMMNYGLEGYTYTDNGDGTITFIDENRAMYTPWRNGMGNIRILPPTAHEGADYWVRFSAYYDAAEALPYGGFIFDATSVEKYEAAIANVWAQYAFDLMSGAVNPVYVLPKFLRQLEAAGINEYVAEANRQLEAYLAG